MNRALVFSLGVTIGVMASYLVWHPAPSYATPRSAQLMPVPPAALSGAPQGATRDRPWVDQYGGTRSGITAAAPQLITGQATWYGTGPGRGHAAAGSELRTGDWRGRHVEVCHAGRCVGVVLDDWCACGGARIIDLSDEDFARLAPLSAGVISVSVRIGGLTKPGDPVDKPLPTGPATDVQP